MNFSRINTRNIWLTNCAPPSVTRAVQSSWRRKPAQEPSNPCANHGLSKKMISGIANEKTSDRAGGNRIREEAAIEFTGGIPQNLIHTHLFTPANNLRKVLGCW